MLFSTKAEYGIRVMVELARRGGDDPISLSDIATANSLPLAYLEHLVAKLKRDNLIESKRGSRGGYLLTKPAAEITMREIIEALEGGVAPIECISGTGDLAALEEEAHGRSCPGYLPSDTDSNACSRLQKSELACPTQSLWQRVQGSIIQTLDQTTLADLAAEQTSGDSIIALTTI